MTRECPHCGNSDVTVEPSLAETDEMMHLVVPHPYEALVEDLPNRLVEAVIIDCCECGGQWECVEDTGEIHRIFAPHGGDLVDRLERRTLTHALSYAFAHAGFNLAR